jgi:hypothetical protein
MDNFICLFCMLISWTFFGFIKVVVIVFHNESISGILVLELSRMQDAASTDTILMDWIHFLAEVFS